MKIKYYKQQITNCEILEEDKNLYILYNDNEKILINNIKEISYNNKIFATIINLFIIIILFSLMFENFQKGSYLSFIFLCFIEYLMIMYFLNEFTNYKYLKIFEINKKMCLYIESTDNINYIYLLIEKHFTNLKLQQNDNNKINNSEDIKK